MSSTLTHLLYHIVYSTKHREPTIEKQWQDDLYAYTGGIIRSLGGVLIAAGGVADHIHVVARLKPEPSMAQTVKTFKAKSSKWVNETHLKARRFYWQTGYGAFSVSPSQLDRVVQYVHGQEEHHKKTTFQEEYIALLDRHGVEYDEKFLWD